MPTDCIYSIQERAIHFFKRLPGWMDVRVAFDILIAQGNEILCTDRLNIILCVYNVFICIHVEVNHYFTVNDDRLFAR